MSAESGPRSHRCLVALHTPDEALRDRSQPLDERLRMGRVPADDIDLAVRDRLISSRHATIRRCDDGRYELLDHDSRNGTFVDGERITKARLRDGQLVRMGISIFELAEQAQPWTDDISHDPSQRLLGTSAAFQHMLDHVRRLAAASGTVIFVGEPGSGKKRLAKFLHDMDPRPGPLVVMECGGVNPELQELDLLGSEGVAQPTAVPGDEVQLPLEGYFSLADGGTLVVDHIEDLSSLLQPHLLKFLREGSFTPVGAETARQVDVRLVVTSSSDIETAVDAGTLSAALAEALGDQQVEVTSLRTRRSDILCLARHFIDLAAPQRHLDWSPGCLERLLLYDWPVNIRELRVVMTRMAALEQGVQTLRSAHLPREIRRQLRQQGDDALRNTIVTVHAVPSRDELRALLKQHAGDIGALAEHYAKDRRHVRRWLLRHDLPSASVSAAAATDDPVT